MSILSPEELSALNRLQISSRRVVLGKRQGIHRSNKRGSGLEFSEFKQYTPGDDFRSIDWNTSARSDKLYSKLFREEQDLTLIIVLDLSKSLKHGQSVLLAKKLALSLAYVTIKSGDKVALVIPGGGQTKASSRPSSYHIIEKLIEENDETKHEDITPAIKLALAQNRLPGKVILISDYLFDLKVVEESLLYISSKSFQATLISLDYEKESGEGILIDSETEEELEREITEEDQREIEKLRLGHYQELESLAHYYKSDFIPVSRESKILDIIYSDLIQSRVLA